MCLQERKWELCSFSQFLNKSESTSIAGYLDQLAFSKLFNIIIYVFQCLGSCADRSYKPIFLVRARINQIACALIKCVTTGATFSAGEDTSSAFFYSLPCPLDLKNHFYTRKERI